MTPHARRKLCGATPPSVHLQPCDKLQGHTGPHRGYLSTVEVVEFWVNEDDIPRDDDPEVAAVAAALARRRTRDEDEE